MWADGKVTGNLIICAISLVAFNTRGKECRSTRDYIGCAFQENIDTSDTVECDEVGDGRKGQLCIIIFRGCVIDG